MQIEEKIKILGNELTFCNIYNILSSKKDTVILDTSSHQISVSAFDGFVRTYAATLSQKLIAKQAHSFVGICLENSPDWPMVFWAVLMAGFCPIFLDSKLTDPELQKLLTESGAVGVITSRKLAIDNHCAQFLLFALKNDGQPADTSAFTPSWADKIALCTSGTTSDSRIFVYDGKAMSNHLINLCHTLKKGDNLIPTKGKVLAFLPFHHIYGFVIQLLYSFFCGYTLVFMKELSAQGIKETCLQKGITHIFTVPLLINNITKTIENKVASQSILKQKVFKKMLLASQLLQKLLPRTGLFIARNLLFKKVLQEIFGTHIQYIVCGGSFSPRASLEMINNLGYRCFCGFGMTEAGVTSLETSIKYDKRVSGSIGQPIFENEYKIDASAGGHMLLRGKTLHVARLIGGGLTPPDTDEDGWFATGDVAEVRDHSYYIIGREKDVIINDSGENIYPDRIESCFASIETVEQLTVLGMPKDKAYEHVTLVVYVKEELHHSGALEKYANHFFELNRNLPIQSRVDKIIFVNSPFPMVNGIKVKRRDLKDMILNKKIKYKEFDIGKYSPQKPQGKRPKDISNRIRSIMAEILAIQRTEIKDDAHFIYDLGADSLQSMELYSKLETEFEQNIVFDEFMSCTCVCELSQLMESHMAGKTGVLQQSDAPLLPISKFRDSPEFKELLQRKEAISHLENPYFTSHQSTLKDVSLLENHQEVLNFGSYNYLCMSGRPEVSNAAISAIEKYGTSASGSRLLAGEKPIHNELEREIADWKGTQDAIVLVGGHATNVTFIGNFCGKGDLILYDSLSHNSIVQGCKLSDAVSKPFPHNNVEALDKILNLHRYHYAKVLIIIEGVYSMDGDIAPVPAFVQLKKKYETFLMVDEAHSLCVIGETGKGVDEYFHLESTDIDIKMGTLSKGVGTCGGYIAASADIIEYLRYSLPGFVFSVGISPPLAAAAIEAIRFIRKENTLVRKLQQNITTFVGEAKSRGFNTCLAGESAIIPIMVGKDEDAFRLSNALKERGIFVPPAVFPAVPQNQSRLRFCVVSEHKTAQIIFALETLTETAKELKIQLIR